MACEPPACTLGTPLATIHTGGSTNNFGLALLPRAGLLVVSDNNSHSLGVYACGDGAFVRRIGEHGAGPLQFDDPGRLAVSARGSLIVAEFGNVRLQEVTVEGSHVRMLALVDRPFAVACGEGIIVVGLHGASHPFHVLTYCDATGSLLGSYAPAGTTPGSVGCVTGLALASAGALVAEAGRVSLFSPLWALERCVGVGQLGDGDVDVAWLGDDAFVVADPSHHRVCVFRARDGALVESWGGKGTSPGCFVRPSGVAHHDGRLYVLDACTPRVQVFACWMSAEEPG